jgi:3'-phosphoadenosine 5'-phosphosulfate sulfotransferase (PAPS reductase)/FAD synthetase
LQSNSGIPDDATVIFCNTGKEDEATLNFVEKCSKNWGLNIVWLEYDPDNKYKVVNFKEASRNGEPFEQLIRKKKYLPNPVARFCTQDLKVVPIDKYMKAIDRPDYITMIGIRKDEERRIAKVRDGLFAPLVTAKITQKDVQSFWASNDFDLDLKFRDGVTALGNCDLCFLKGTSQVVSIIRQNPERAIWWSDMEEIVGATFRKDRPNYKNLIKFNEQQADMFSDESIPCFCGE